MASPQWKTTADLIAELEREPFAFDFFHAVRLLEAANLSLPRIGASLYCDDDPVRFGQNPSLVFPPSTLESFKPATPDSPASLIVRFFGLFGPNGPMPSHFEERATENVALAQFCNIFHHRLISLYYRAWAVHQKSVDFDRAEPDEKERSSGKGGADWSGPRFSLYLASFFGQGTQAMRHRDDVSDWAKLYFSGILSGRTRHASGLQAILNDYFEVPVEVEPFVGEWLPLPKESFCVLEGEPGECKTLGEDAILGDQIWQSHLKFRLRIGPLSFEDFRRFLPSESGFRHLTGWLLTYLGNSLSWEAQLVLKSREAPPLVLGGDYFLGWSTWLTVTDEEVLKEPMDDFEAVLNSKPDEYEDWAAARRDLTEGMEIVEVEAPGGRAHYCFESESETAASIALASSFVLRRYVVRKAFSATVSRYSPGELSGRPNPHRARQLLFQKHWPENVDLIWEAPASGSRVKTIRPAYV